MFQEPINIYCKTSTHYNVSSVKSRNIMVTDQHDISPGYKTHKTISKFNYSPFRHFSKLRVNEEKFQPTSLSTILNGHKIFFYTKFVIKPDIKSKITNFKMLKSHLHDKATSRQDGTQNQQNFYNIQHIQKEKDS